MWVEWWGRWSDWPMTWCIQCYISSWNNHYKDMDESHCHIGDLLSSPVPRVCSCHSLIYWTNFHRWYTSGWHCLKSNKLITEEKKKFSRKLGPKMGLKYLLQTPLLLVHSWKQCSRFLLHKAAFKSFLHTLLYLTHCLQQLARQMMQFLLQLSQKADIGITVHSF